MKSSGKGEALPPPPPLRTVRATFTAHGSSRSLPSVLPVCGCSAAPFPRGVRWRANRRPLTCPSEFGRCLQPSSGDPPGPRQPAFAAGRRPLQPVMSSRCLSAAGLGFLGHRVPPGVVPSLRRAYRPGPDPVGVSTFRSGEMRRGGMPSLLRGPRCPSVPRKGRHACVRPAGVALLTRHRRLSHRATT